MDDNFENNKNVAELLEVQIQLLTKILVDLDEQMEWQIANDKVITEWHQASLQEQKNQAKYLANISMATSAVAFLIFLSAAAWFCLGTGIF